MKRFNLKLFAYLVSLVMLSSISYAEEVEIYPTKDQEVLTATSPENKTISVILPRRAIDASQLAVLINSQDPQSVKVAEYYAQTRNIPAENLIYLSFTPNRTMIRAAEFKALKEQVDATVALLPDIQAYAITWTTPWAVYHDTMSRGMSITSAFALSFQDKYYNYIPGNICTSTRSHPAYNAYSYRPFNDFGMRPTMMLGGTSFDNVKELIDRGKSSDSTFPLEKGFLVRTKDLVRSGRYKDFDMTADLWNRPDGLAIDSLNRSAAGQTDYLVNEQNVLFYLTGLANVPQITSNSYVPGAVADHLTSFGGKLTGPNTQMSALRWLEAGATGSYGTMEEPCAYLSKFSNSNLLVRHYFLGATLLEAYWKSIDAAGEGVFVGDPLARPYGTKVFIDSKNMLNIKTTILKPNRMYKLLAGNSIAGPFVEVMDGITIGNIAGAFKTITTPTTFSLYLLKEDIPDSSADMVMISSDMDSQSELNIVSDSKQVLWLGTHNVTSNLPGSGLSIGFALYQKDHQSGIIRKAFPQGIYTDLRMKLHNNKILFYGDTYDDDGNTLPNTGFNIIDLETGLLEHLPIPEIPYLRSFYWNDTDIYWSQIGSFYYTHEIHRYNLATKQTEILVQTDNYDQIEIQPDFDFAGDYLMWTSYYYENFTKTQYVRNLQTGEEIKFSDNPSDETSNTKHKFTGNNKIVWFRHVKASNENMVMEYDMMTKKEKVLMNLPIMNDYDFLKNGFVEANKDWLLLWIYDPITKVRSLHAYNFQYGASSEIKFADSHRICDISPTCTGMGGITSLLGDNLFIELYSPTEFLADLYKIKLKLDNYPPVFDQMANRVVAEGQTLTFSVTATDPDGDNLTYTIDNLPASNASLSGNKFTWTPNYDQSGEYRVTFKVSDGQFSDEQTITINVLDVPLNAPPVIDPLSDVTGYVGKLIKVRVFAVDQENDPITFVASGLPSGAVFLPLGNVMGNGKLIAIDLRRINQYVIKFNNPTLTDAQKQLADFNEDGIINSFDVQNLLQVLTGVKPPKNVYLLLWTPSANQVGDHHVTFSVKDKKSAPVTETITISIQPTPQKLPRTPPLRN
ncbi:MAG: TIGR03790 family protein [Candidatus Omnitrophica bacterium]|nr:TIGR03790 family protein [Candidatus Omnitrophota bacterium]